MAENRALTPDGQGSSPWRRTNQQTPSWRNWQTHRSQKPGPTGHVRSTRTEGTSYYQQDKDWFYRAEERRWITLNDNSGWRRIERVGKRIKRGALHVA